MRKYPLLTIIVGATNTGKTSLLLELIKNRKRVLTITPHFTEWTDYENIYPVNKGFWKFNGIRRCQSYLDVLKDINQDPGYFRNGVLIFEESDFYVNRNVENAVKQILGARDQRKTDIYITAHGLTHVPPIFFSYTDVFIFFKTQDNLSKRKKDLIWYDDLLKLQKKVNEQAKNDFHYYDYFKTK